MVSPSRSRPSNEVVRSISGIATRMTAVARRRTKLDARSRRARPERRRPRLARRPAPPADRICRATRTFRSTATRRSRRGHATSRRRRNAPRSRSSSRTCTGPTTRCSSSSSGSWSVPPRCRSSCFVPPGQSCIAQPAGVGRRSRTRNNDLALAADRPGDGRPARRPAAAFGDVGRRTVRRCMRRAGGNPLYAREFVHMLEDRGRRRGSSAREPPGAGVPDTVQALIAARLDALDAAERVVLQAASVIGDRFWTGCARCARSPTRPTSKSSLRTLQRRGLIRRSSTSSIASEAELSFAHALIRDVAYGRLPRPARSRLHRASHCLARDRHRRRHAGSRRPVGVARHQGARSRPRGRSRRRRARARGRRRALPGSRGRPSGLARRRSGRRVLPAGARPRTRGR